MLYDEDEISAQEEKKHARRGTCLAVILLPLLFCCVVGLLTSYTSGGRVLVAKLMLNTTYHGNSVFNIPGFAEVAQASCDLDRIRPRPSTYDEDQATLDRRYQNNLRIYRKYWKRLEEDEADPGQYPPPSHIAQTLHDAKIKYCQ
jgi:hypothetical protein